MAKKKKQELRLVKEGGGSPSQPRTLKLVWQQEDSIESVFADSMHLAFVNNQYYLTFGQIAPPVVAEGAGPEVTAEIRKVTRIVVSDRTLKQILILLDRYSKAGGETP